jgi:type II secretory ATPase GspE/PulE/Tfp pilus assembly ATPase PilB-like protein
MVVTAAIRSLILERASASAIQDVAVGEGTQLLRENGLEKVLSGTTSFAELTRIVV